MPSEGAVHYADAAEPDTITGYRQMSPSKRLQTIIDDGLCLGCGLCSAVAGPQALTFGRGKDGEPQPLAGPDLNDDVMDLVYDICPGFNLEGLPPAIAAAAPNQDLVWGPHVRMVQAHAGNPRQRHRAATGGVLTALACHLLDSGRVGLVAHVRAASDPPHFGEATVSRTADEAFAAAGSRYGPTAALLSIAALLDAGEPFALIAKPCDLNAMRRLAHHDPRVNKLVRYWLTPVCGGFMPDAGFRQFARRMGHDPDSITAVRYRGHGCPGPTRIEHEDGTAADHHYLDVWGQDDSQWVLPFRCKICADGIGEAADIAAADNWDGGAPTRELADTDPGSNAVIIRTASGAALFDEAVAAGALVEEMPLGVDDLSRMQPHHVKKKLSGLARSRGLAEAGSLAPRLVNMRAEALDATLGEEAATTEQQGAARRARARRYVAD